MSGLVSILFLLQKEMVDNLVIAPLNRLIGLCVGPNNVIEKRFDKLLDYESQMRKAKDSEKVSVIVHKCVKGYLVYTLKWKN